MWTISMLKENAKAALKGFYWTAVLVTLIVSLLGGGGSSSYSSSADTSDISEIIEEYGYTDDYDDDYYEEYYEDAYGNDYSVDLDGGSSAARTAMAGFLAVFGVVLLVAVIAAMVFYWFVSVPVIVGQNIFYLDARKGDVGVGKIFGSFKSGRYLSTIATMFIMNLKIFLWSLLFIIPGVIKSYQYILVPYIIAENPHIDRRRAFDISRQTMEGEKLNCWLLQLSFIGWFLLGSITIIGNLFIMPYYNATMAEFYCCMKQKALSTGIASSYELGDESNVTFESYVSSPFPAEASGERESKPAAPSYTPGIMDEIQLPLPDSNNGDNGDDSYTGPEIK